MSSKLEKNFIFHLRNYINMEIEDVAPSIQVLALARGKKILDLSFGKPTTYFDLASLTKILFSIPAFMYFQSNNYFSLLSPVKNYLPWWKNPSTRIVNLMTHSAGLPLRHSIYKNLQGKMDPDLRWQQLPGLISSIPIGANKKSMYSDLNFLVLGFILQELYQKPLIDIFLQINQKINCPSLHFNPSHRRKFSKKLYAPTENCIWRKTIMQGQVHDETTWALAGVAPQSGLFGQMRDIEVWMRLIRKIRLGEKSSLTQAYHVRRYTRRQFEDWGLGFMKPSVKDSSAGNLSQDSYGHLGFTGTSLWMDPRRDLCVGILSNRVALGRNHRNIAQFRPAVHNAIILALKNTG